MQTDGRSGGIHTGEEPNWDIVRGDDGSVGVNAVRESDAQFVYIGELDVAHATIHEHASPGPETGSSDPQNAWLTRFQSNGCHPGLRRDLVDSFALHTIEELSSSRSLNVEPAT